MKGIGAGLAALVMIGALAGCQASMEDTARATAAADNAGRAATRAEAAARRAEQSVSKAEDAASRAEAVVAKMEAEQPQAHSRGKKKM